MILKLCEYAATNSDGTFTIIRGGLEFLATKQLPVPVDVWLMIELEPRSLPAGESPILITVNTVAGEEMVHLEGIARVGPLDSAPRFAVPVRFTANSYGSMTLRCRIGDHLAQLDFYTKEED